MHKQDLLIEIGTEELPPKALLSLSEAFAAEIAVRLQKVGLEFSSIDSFATPRRLAMIVHQLADHQADAITEKLGPALSAAIGADGKPTKAAEGFARSCGVEFADLKHKTEGNVIKLVHRSERKGDTTAT